MFEEVVFCASGPAPANSSLGSISLNDLQSGNSIFSLKQTGAGRNGVAIVESTGGLGGFLLCVQAEKAMLQAYSFQKDQMMSKMVLPEKMCCIAVDRRGHYAACGTVNGRIYLWEIPSGILFNSWEAHYRKVTALSFNDNGAILVSGSDDSSIHVWEIASLVDNLIPFEIPTPFCSFTAHTLMVTDLVVGFGVFPLCRIMSSSIDCSVKIWDVKTKQILSTFIFPAPITSLAWDRTERVFFAASPKGDIHRINLYQKSKHQLQTGAAAMEAIGGGAASGEQILVAGMDAENSRLIPVGDPVTCMSTSINAIDLLVGTQSGLVHIYDIHSHQLLRSITNHKGQPIAMVRTMIKPLDLMGHIEIGETSASREDIPVRAVQTFQRVRDPKAREAHEVMVLLPPTNIVPLRTQNEIYSDILAEHASFTREEEDGNSTDPSNALRDRVSELETEVARLKGQLVQAKNINDTMWETITRKVLIPNTTGPESNTTSGKEVDMIPLEDDSTTRKRSGV